MAEELEDMIMDMEETSSIEDVKAEEYSDPKAGQIVAFVKERFEKAENARETEEHRWIQAYRNYRGIYGPGFLPVYVVWSRQSPSFLYLRHLLFLVK